MIWLSGSSWPSSDTGTTRGRRKLQNRSVRKDFDILLLGRPGRRVISLLQSSWLQGPKSRPGTVFVFLDAQLRATEQLRIVWAWLLGAWFVRSVRRWSGEKFLNLLCSSPQGSDLDWTAFPYMLLSESGYTFPFAKLVISFCFNRIWLGIPLGQGLGCTELALKIIKLWVMVLAGEYPIFGSRLQLGGSSQFRAVSCSLNMQEFWHICKIHASLSSSHPRCFIYNPH